MPRLLLHLEVDALVGAICIGVRRVAPGAWHLSIIPARTVGSFELTHEVYVKVTVAMISSRISALTVMCSMLCIPIQPRAVVLLSDFCISTSQSGFAQTRSIQVVSAVAVYFENKNELHFM